MQELEAVRQLQSANPRMVVTSIEVTGDNDGDSSCIDCSLEASRLNQITVCVDEATKIVTSIWPQIRSALSRAAWEEGKTARKAHQHKIKNGGLVHHEKRAKTRHKMMHRRARSYPQRPGKPICETYMRTGRCERCDNGKACIADHPIVLTETPTEAIRDKGVQQAAELTGRLGREGLRKYQGGMGGALPAVDPAAAESRRLPVMTTAALTQTSITSAKRNETYVSALYISGLHSLPASENKPSWKWMFGLYCLDKQHPEVNLRPHYVCASGGHLYFVTESTESPFDRIDGVTKRVARGMWVLGPRPPAASPDADHNTCDHPRVDTVECSAYSQSTSEAPPFGSKTWRLHCHSSQVWADAHVDISQSDVEDNRLGQLALANASKVRSYVSRFATNSDNSDITVHQPPAQPWMTVHGIQIDGDHSGGVTAGRRYAKMGTRRKGVFARARENVADRRASSHPASASPLSDLVQMAAKVGEEFLKAKTISANDALDRRQGLDMVTGMSCGGSPLVGCNNRGIYPRVLDHASGHA
eukprot:SAG31_NODE_488_length_14964_cov_56.443458_14_plen_531_part_00